jgi:Ser/Thr protein kinase RdoA (MazF antagonist)
MNTPIDEQCLSNAVRAHYRLDTDTFRFSGQWLRSRLYRLGPYYAKVFPPSTDLVRLHSQCAAWELANQKTEGLSLVNLLRRTDGTFATQVNGCFFVLMKHVHGRRPFSDISRLTTRTQSDAARLGEAAAQLEVIFDRVARNSALTSLRVQQTLPYNGAPSKVCPDQLFAALARHPYLKKSIDCYGKLLLRSVALLVAPSNVNPEMTLLHGDLRPGNCLLHRDGVVVLDFETIHFGWRGFDLLYLIWTSAQRILPDSTKVLKTMAHSYLRASGGRTFDCGHANRLLTWCWIQELWLLSQKDDPRPINIEPMLRAVRDSLTALEAGKLLQ